LNTWQSQQPTWGSAFLDTFLAALSTRPAAALLVAPKLRLSVDPAFAPSPGMTIAALAAHETDFSGYTAGGYALTLAGPVTLTTNAVGEVASAVAVAAAAAPFIGGQITGYWVDDGTNVVLAEAFGPAGPVPIAAPGDFCQVDVRFPLTNLTAAA
jgi:hypothetical protein